METVYLHGSEDVRAAAHRMQQAAETMQQAAGTIQEALTNHERFLTAWLSELRAVLEAVPAGGK